LQKEAKKSEDMKEVVLNALDDMKAKDVSIVDVRGRTSVTDFMIIASATSSRHVSSVAENLVTEVKQHGGRPLGVEGGEGSDWLLVDLGDIVVHIMMPSTREYYDLERFWKTSPMADGTEAYS
jgi:ribosome-associated protein